MKHLRILCTADLHLGRRLVEMPEGLERYAQAPREAWIHLVEYAIEPSNAVDAVVIAGDIFDNEQNLYEAIGVFERGLGRLCRQGIPVVAVAGNHDVRVLSKCRKRMEREGFYLLGERGEWEECLLELKGIAVRLFGWSFTAMHSTESPLESFPPLSTQDLVIGVVHGDTEGGSESRYAPIALGQIASLPVQAWVLGHLHTPRILTETPLAFYCGTPQGLDPSERGAHGAYLLEVSPSGACSCRFLPMARLFWSQEQCDLSHVATDSLDSFLNDALQQRFAGIPEETEAVICRLLLTGRTPCYPYLKAFKQRVEGKLFSHVGGRVIPCYIESVEVNCRPDIDLEELSRGKDAVAILAHTLRLIEAGGREEALSDKALAYFHEKVRNAPQVEKTFSKQELHALLIAAGYEALDLLLSQKEE